MCAKNPGCLVLSLKRQLEHTKASCLLDLPLASSPAHLSSATASCRARGERVGSIRAVPPTHRFTLGLPPCPRLRLVPRFTILASHPQQGRSRSILGGRCPRAARAPRPGPRASRWAPYAEARQGESVRCSGRSRSPSLWPQLINKRRRSVSPRPGILSHPSLSLRTVKTCMYRAHTGGGAPGCWRWW